MTVMADISDVRFLVQTAFYLNVCFSVLDNCNNPTNISILEDLIGIRNV